MPFTIVLFVPRVQKSLLQTQNFFLMHRHNACYFDRTARPDERLCDMNGLFQCEGPYDEDKCSGFHFINPYASREARIIFSTWNLDHV